MTVTEWCSGGNSQCSSGQTYSIKIVGFKNPSTSVFPSNSIKVEITTSANKMVDSVTTNFFATPQVDYGPLASASISKTPDIVGQSTTYTVNFETGTSGDLSTDKGFLFIQFPSGFTYASTSSPTLTCQVKLASSSSYTTLNDCSSTTTTDSIGISVLTVRANLKCGTLITCASSTSYSF